ncbi:unnamed protein product [Prorocentrum cordatum]|uniref:Uncharacterized protein n=1 Tax=Prorocentrum cordatum TaxID=2364126 RepID=A0ABN9T8Z1_9DINO|nr:unnamed protein product [Polarella glacialis]
MDIGPTMLTRSRPRAPAGLGQLSWAQALPAVPYAAEAHCCNQAERESRRRALSGSPEACSSGAGGPAQSGAGGPRRGAQVGGGEARAAGAPHGGIPGRLGGPRPPACRQADYNAEAQALKAMAGPTRSGADSMGPS